MRVFRKVGYMYATLLMLLMAILATPSASAYFWTDAPASWDYDDEPPEWSEDGTGSAAVIANEGSCSVTLNGGPNVLDPDYIDFTEDEVGYTLMFVVSYHLLATPYYSEDTLCGVELELWHHEDLPGFQKVDSMGASVQTLLPAINISEEVGWLYVWMDVDYTDEPQFRLDLETYAKYWDGSGWVHFENSPQTVSVWFEVDDLT